MKKCEKITGLRFVDTSSKADKKSNNKSKPDLSVYTTSEGKNNITVLSWPDLEMFIEWKDDAHLDAFRSSFLNALQPMDSNSVKGTETRGQIYSYAAQVLDSQQRRSLFSVGICGDWVRFYYFDASCVVVTEPISFRDHPEVVVEFFVRYGSMTAAERGYDTTVVPATPAEKRTFRSRISDYKKRVIDEELRLHPDVEDLNLL